MKRELARVKKERDFLREAATFFAKASADPALRLRQPVPQRRLPGLPRSQLLALLDECNEALRGQGACEGFFGLLKRERVYFQTVRDFGVEPASVLYEIAYKEFMAR